MQKCKEKYVKYLQIGMHLQNCIFGGFLHVAMQLLLNTAGNSNLSKYFGSKKVLHN